MTAPNKLNAKQELAIGALLSERTQEAAAARAGVAEKSLRRWLADPACVAEYRAARRQVVEAAVGRLQRAASKAVGALTRNLPCGKPNVEVRVAEVILGMALRGVELTDLAQQLDELKAALESRTHHPCHPAPRGAPAADRGGPGRA
jgi:hypothetical protein